MCSAGGHSDESAIKEDIRKTDHDQKSKERWLHGCKTTHNDEMHYFHCRLLRMQSL